MSSDADFRFNDEKLGIIRYIVRDGEILSAWVVGPPSDETEKKWTSPLPKKFGV